MEGERAQAKPSANEAEKIHGSCGRDYPALSLFSISYLRKILTVKQAQLGREAFQSKKYILQILPKGGRGSNVFRKFNFCC